MNSSGCVLVISVFVLLLLLTLPARGQTTAFQHDFNGDFVGAPPSSSPPGDPDQDQLNITATNGASALVQAEVGTLTDQPLLVTRPPNTFGIVQAVVDPDLTTCRQYVVRWRSLLRQTGPNLVCAISAANSSSVGSVGYLPDGGLFFPQPSSVLSVDYTPDVDQLFEVSIDVELLLMSLSIDGVEVPEVQGIPVNEETVDGVRILQIAGSGSLAGEYAVDDILIVGFDCLGTAMKTQGWSSLKARYR